MRRKSLTVILWVIACAASEAISDVVARQINRRASAQDSSQILAMSTVLSHFIVPAGLIGISQWLILRRLVARAGWWFPLTTIGLAAGFCVFGPVVNTVRSVLPTGELIWALLAGKVVAGAIAGIAQWILMRRWAPSAFWWILASVVGMGATTLVIRSLIVVSPNRLAPASDINAAIVGALTAAAYGSVTGAALVLLLRHPRLSPQGFEVIVGANTTSATGGSGQPEA